MVNIGARSAVPLSPNTTASGARRCVTLTLMAETVEQVEAVYERLYLVEQLFLIL